MAMNLRLSDEQSARLRAVADQDGISMQEAALRAIDDFTSRRSERLTLAISRVVEEDAELLKRLAK